MNVWEGARCLRPKHVDPTHLLLPGVLTLRNYPPFEELTSILLPEVEISLMFLVSLSDIPSPLGLDLVTPC